MARGGATISDRSPRRSVPYFHRRALFTFASVLVAGARTVRTVITTWLAQRSYLGRQSPTFGGRSCSTACSVDAAYLRQGQRNTGRCLPSSAWPSPSTSTFQRDRDGRASSVSPPCSLPMLLFAGRCGHR